MALVLRIVLHSIGRLCRRSRLDYTLGLISSLIWAKFGVDRTRHAAVDRAQNGVVTHFLLARHITHRTINQLPQQRLIKGFGVRRARLVPIALLRRRRMIIASRTAETLWAQLDEYSLFQNRQMPQADRIIVAVKLKGLLPAPRADRIGARTLNCDDNLSLFNSVFRTRTSGRSSGNSIIGGIGRYLSIVEFLDLSLPQLQLRSKTTRYWGFSGSSQRAVFNQLLRSSLGA
jgi:hypothetical protein